MSMKNYHLLNMLNRDVWIVSEHLEHLKLAWGEIVTKELDAVCEYFDLDPNDPDEAEALEMAQSAIDENYVTRLLTGSAILVIWALYETTVKKCADILRQTKKSKLKMSDLKGAFLDQAEKYYSEVLKTPLHPESVDMSRLRKIAAVRHAFAHANGELEYVNEKDQNIISDLADKNDQVNIFTDSIVYTSEEDPDKYSDWVRKNQRNIVTGSLVVTQEFVSECWEFIRPLIEELIERTKASFKAMDDTSA